MADNPSFPTRDLHFRIEGPVVAQLQEVFAEDWTFTTRERLEGKGRKSKMLDGTVRVLRLLPGRGYRVDAGELPAQRLVRLEFTGRLKMA
jgi:phosphatidylserine/phosphatidylglycerophosphate/cardiolipin synthase-like enzyme